MFEVKVVDTDPMRVKAIADEISRQIISQSPTSDYLQQLEGRQAFVQQQLDSLQNHIHQAEIEIAEKQATLKDEVSARAVLDRRDEIQALMLNLTGWRSTYASLLSSFQGRAPNTLSVIESAYVPTEPVGPDVKANVLMAAALGGPDDIPALFRQAREAEQRREFATALRCYNRVLSLDARIAEVWANKGLVLHELERHREALAAFDRAAELKPSLLVPQLFRGIERLRLGQPAQAVAPLEAALALQPGNPEAVNALAHACLQTGRFKRAVALFEAFTAADPAGEFVRAGGHASTSTN
jgi:tetratricopeptide (TPR) repeat protein